MKYSKRIILKDGRACVIRNGTEQDGEQALACFMLTHEQTDNLALYPDENSAAAGVKFGFIQKMMADSADEAELVAELDGYIAGLAGIDRISSREKMRHRVLFGISIDKAFWGLGIGRALTEACVECAKSAGYAQMELEVVADNVNAIELYKSVGFVEYGRNPRGFCSRYSGWQELVLMRLELR